MAAHARMENAPRAKERHLKVMDRVPVAMVKEVTLMAVMEGMIMLLDQEVLKALKRRQSNS